MKTKTILAVTLLLGTFALGAQTKLNVVSTLPDFAALAEAIGGDKVQVTSIARGTEDPHFVDARPSFIRLLNRADVLLEGGAQLEVGWLPPLVNNARNPKILGDGPGHVIMSRGIALLDVPTGPIDRSKGDVHPAGNPHFWLDPANGKIMAEHLAEAFGQVDSANRAVYQANLAKFHERLDKKIAEWTKLMEPFRGTKVVTYHKSYEYFARRFGLEIAGQIEPKPGIEPSPSHINRLIPEMKQLEVKLVWAEPNRPRKTAEYLAEAIGARLLIIPSMVGGNERVKDYFSLFDDAIAQISGALKEAK